MPLEYETDPELERSTNRVMVAGIILMVALALAFPLYLSVEPSSRESSRADNLESLATEGEAIWGFNCAACHGGAQAGGHGSGAELQAVPCSQPPTSRCGRWSRSASPSAKADAGVLLGPRRPPHLEQIRAVTTYVRTWRHNAPIVPTGGPPRSPTPPRQAPTPPPPTTGG
ncbi:MAG: hypothetical protein R2746_10375 [Acidimicrobiales bacterium]